MKITAKPNPGRPGFRCTFRHPETGKPSSYGLATQDSAEAQRICNDVVTIFSKPALLKDDKNPALLAYHYRAVQIVHGDEAATELFRRKQKPVLAKEDVDTLGARILLVVEEVLNLTLTDTQKAEAQGSIDATLQEFESQRYKEVQDRLEDAENRAKSVEPRMIELEAENARLRRQNNADVKETVGEVVKAWKAWYEPDHSAATVAHAFPDIDSFVQTLPGGADCKLRDVNSDHVSQWLDSLSKRGLGPTSRRNARAYLSSFFNKFACKDPYRLFENPVDAARGVEGIDRHPEKIVAIRRREHIDDLLALLKPYPYWRAWIAMATLCGPRWAEMQWLKVDDCYLEDGYFRIATRDFKGKNIGTKTGRERSVPFERTTALEILTGHIQTRQAAQKRKTGTTADKSPWLFPSTLPEHAFMEREKSLPGQWSGNSAWRNQWDDVSITLAVQVGALKLTKAETFTDDDSKTDVIRKRVLRSEKLATLASSKYAWLGYGPQEWRHTFGTACFMCGLTALEISRLMGNSPVICEKRYISGAIPGKRWEFKWS